MSSTSITESTATSDQLIARILSEVLAGRVSLLPHEETQEFSLPIKMVFGKLRQALGGAPRLDQLVEAYRPATHAFADLVMDYVILGSATGSTRDKLECLPVVNRSVVETFANELTGRPVLNRHRDARWNDILWNLKGLFERICAMSPSGITPEELREGFDGILHAVVNDLLK